MQRRPRGGFRGGRQNSRFNGNGNGNRRGYSRFSRGRKRLDPRLFVKKAVVQTQEEYAAQHEFGDFAFSDEVKQSITNRGYITPTPIQDKAIPALLEGKDVIGIANTGTGKTAAFLLPLIEKIYQNSSEGALIITPTRELALQIETEFNAFARTLRLSSVVCIGGASMYKQIKELRRRPHFVIGTPGRLRDLEKQGMLRFEEYGSIVLDEVDRMLDMGFINEIKYVISKLPPKRQALFFSATMPTKLQSLARSFLVNPVTISVKVGNSSANVDQDIVRVGSRHKVDILHDLLIKEDFRKVLVFGRTKRGIETLSDNLGRRGIRVATIHGNKNQRQRERALLTFRKDRVQVLLATDVASRGLDIKDVSHVINFDAPESYDDYVHRIGRTGRANRKGVALTFVD